MIIRIALAAWIGFEVVGIVVGVPIGLKTTWNTEAGRRALHTLSQLYPGVTPHRSESTVAAK